MDRISGLCHGKESLTRPARFKACLTVFPDAAARKDTGLRIVALAVGTMMAHVFMPDRGRTRMFNRGLFSRSFKILNSRVLLGVVTLILCVCSANVGLAEDTPNTGVKLELPESLAGGPENGRAPRASARQACK